MRSANRSRGNPPPTRSGTACSGKKSNSPSSPDAINRPLTRIRHGDSRHRNRNAQYLVGPSSKDFQALRENPPYGMIGGIEERSSRQGRSLAGCKSPYRQLPVVGRLAYPMRGEVTNRVLLGRKSPGCPAGVFAAVGTIWGASKLGGRNIMKYLQPRKSPRAKSFQAG